MSDPYDEEFLDDDGPEDCCECSECEEFDGIDTLECTRCGRRTIMTTEQIDEYWRRWDEYHRPPTWRERVAEWLADLKRSIMGIFQRRAGDDIPF